MLSQSLHEIAAAFRGSMPAEGRVLVFRIDGLDRIGVPVVQASLLMPDQPATIGYGYGLTAIEAEVGALGELCEEVHVGAKVANAAIRTSGYAALASELGERGVVDPLTLCLPAGCDYTADTTLDWVEARRWPTGEAVMVPREWVAAYPYQLTGRKPRLITPITNGLGAGFDIAHAIAHGLMELTQRDGNVVSFRALDQGVVVELDIEQEATVRLLLERLRALDIDVTVKLASTDLGLADLYVVGDDRGEPTVAIQITACGEASHPDRARGLRKALLEFIGSRARKAATHGPIGLVRDHVPPDYAGPQIEAALLEEEENRALDAMAEWVGQGVPELRRRLAPRVFAERSRVKFSSLPTAPAARIETSDARLALLAERLGEQDLDIVWIDCSPADSPVKVVKVIVPGLESETMSYHRIGWRGVARLRARGDALLLDAPRPGAKRVLMRPQDEARAGGPAWFDAEAADRQVALLYPMYRECGPFAAQLLLERQRAA